MRALVMLLLIAGRAHGAPTDAIVLASAEPTLQAALREMLAPAGIQVVFAPDVAAPALLEIAGASRELADRENASATVWLVFSADGATLVAYDRSVDRVLLRPLPAATLPLSTAQAEEASRMVRTMLRALRITPDSNLPPPHPVEAAIVRARAADAETAVIEIHAPRPRIALEVGAGARVRGPGDATTPAATIALLVRPNQLGLAVTAQLTPGSDVSGSGVMARISDEALALTVRHVLPIASTVTFASSGGVALHRVRLRGTAGGGADVDQEHFDPAVRVGAAASYALSPILEVGVGLSADCLLRRQKYDAGPDEVVSVPLVQLTAGVMFRANLW